MTIDTTDYRSLCAELADSVELLLEMRPKNSKPMQITEDRLNRARSALSKPIENQIEQSKIVHLTIDPESPSVLPPDYIDSEHTGKNRDLLETFYCACQSEGGTADEICLRGLKSVLDRWGHPVIDFVPSKLNMQYYKDLKLIGTPENLNMLFSDISSDPLDGWTRNRGLEEKITMGFYCFTCDENLERRSANLWISTKNNLNCYHLSNIIPCQGDDLSCNDYNQILSNFVIRLRSSKFFGNVQLVINPII